jgi:hypothetical protein
MKRLTLPDTALGGLHICPQVLSDRVSESTGDSRLVHECARCGAGGPRKVRLRPNLPTWIHFDARPVVPLQEMLECILTYRRRIHLY